MTSREAALERRRALTTAGKKAAGRYSSSPGRVRTAADARPSRTTETGPGSEELMTAAAPAARPATRRSTRPARPAMTPPAPVREPSRSLRPVPNPSRELVLARREALSRRGKRADTTRDRNRAEVFKNRAATAAAAPAAPPAEPPAAAVPSLSLDRASLASRNGQERRNGSRRHAQHNPGRSLVLARRQALSQRGKAASMPSSTSSAAVARQGNPDLSTRELAMKVRELKSKVGSAGCARGSGCRPTGPNRHGARQDAAADAHWKVGASQTSGGQVVTGTQANRSLKTTGNEASTCRPITGTEYLGAEIFSTFCQTPPPATQPPKVRVTATSHGNPVTGNEVGRSVKVTGDEPGTCKNVTGTEYLGADQLQAWCGAAPASPRKVGRSRTHGGQAVSGVMVGRSERVTGDEPGSRRPLTGDQYVTETAEVTGRAPSKVRSLTTLRGSEVTGTAVGRSEHVTGDEPGSCRNITGDEYIGTDQYERFCAQRPTPEAAKVGFSVTNRSQVVSGTRTGRSPRVTGDEPGTCKAVTGTPYAGLEEAGAWCATPQVEEIRVRTPDRLSTRMSGIQPGIGGVMTGAERGACEDITGTPYVGPDQLAAACGPSPAQQADFPQSLDTAPWGRFSVQSPARAAQLARERSAGVTGTAYERGNHVTGPFDMAAGKVTGTEQFRFDRPSSNWTRGPLVPAPDRADSAPVTADEDLRPHSRVTGEGLSTGLRITGDDWDRGERITGTEGASARRRNPTRPGPMTAMPAFQPKRNDEVPEPVSRVTGSSGNTAAGSLITVSGGARG